MLMVVLYSRVIQSMKKEESEPPDEGYTEETIKMLVTEALAGMRQEMVTHLEASMSQQVKERLTIVEVKQAGAIASLKEEQATVITETVRVFPNVDETNVLSKLPVPQR